MLCADDAGVVSQSPEQLTKMMGVIVPVCVAFGLTVSNAKTEITPLRTKRMLESATTFSVEAAGQVYSQTNEFVNLGENVNHNADLSIEVNRRIRHAWCTFRKHTVEVYDRPSAPLESKFGCSEPSYSIQCCTAASRGAHARPLRHAASRPAQLTDSLHRLAKEQSRRPPDFLSGQCLSRREVKASRRLYAGGRSCSRDLWRAWGIRDWRSAGWSED